MTICIDYISLKLGLTPLSEKELIDIDESFKKQLENNKKQNPVKNITIYSPFRDDPDYDFKLKNCWNSWNESSNYEKIEQTKDKLRKANKKQFDNPTLRKKHLDGCLEKDANHKNKIWINKDYKNKRVTKENYELNFSDWNKGRYIPEETAFWNYDKTGQNNPYHKHLALKKVNNNAITD
jgi:hypothetical protein